MSSWIDGLAALLAGAAARGAVVGVAALAILMLIRRLPASTRHRILVVVVLAHPVFLMAPHLLPAIDLPILPGPGDAPGPIAKVVDPGGQGPVGQEAIGGAPASGAAPAVTGSRIPVITILAALWGCIALANLMRIALDHRALARLRRTSSTAAEGRATRLLEESRQALGVRAKVDLLFHAGIRIPTTWGSRRPAVFLPPEARSWSEARLRMVLLHETAHIRRRDGMLRLLARLARALFWFTPVTGLACRRLQDEAEIACDEMVVQQGIAPADYAEQLLAIVSGAGRPGQPVAAPGIVTATGLRRRVELLVERGGKPWRKEPAARLVAGMALAAILLAVSVVQMSAQPLIDLSPSASARATGCLYTGGRHHNRVVDGPDGGLRWLVLWDGDGCNVSFESDVAGLEPSFGGLTDLPPGGRLAVSVESGGGRFGLKARRDAAGAVQLQGRALDGAPVSGPETSSWLERFIVELDRHSGNLAGRRVPDLLREGGVERVLREAEKMQGDHAAAVYLMAALSHGRVADRELARMLELAARKVSSDAAMSQFLSMVRERSDLEEPTVRAAYLEAASRLQSRAAREAALQAYGPSRSSDQSVRKAPAPGSAFSHLRAPTDGSSSR